MKYALIENGMVTNVVLLADVVDWHTPTDILVKSDTANIGDSYNGTDIIPAPPAPITWAEYQQQAQALLIKSDTVAIRCAKKGIAFPANWQAYDDALRVIVDPKNTAGDPTLPLPTKLAYPAGT
jgi:hypothetical protein